MSLFDQLDEDQNVKAVEKPLWAMDLDDPQNEEALLKWLNQDLDYAKQGAQFRLEEIRRHIAIYRNQQFSQKVQFNKSEQEFGPTMKKNRMPRMTVNHIYDLVEQLVSRIVKFKPAVSYLPVNNEFEDKISSKIADMFWKHIRDQERFDITNEQMVRLTKICGECFLMILWDEDKGDEAKESKELRKKGQEFMTLRDEDGNPEKDEAGNVIKIPLGMKIGDVCYEIAFPWKVFMPKKRDFNHVDYMYWEHEAPVEELRMDFPEKASKIKMSREKVFDFEEFRDVQLDNETQYYKFYHKKTKFMPEGREIWFTKDAILKNEPLKYEHGELPMEKFGDLEQPGQAHDRSFIVNIRHLVSRYNDLTTNVVRNHALFSHPKWFVPRGSVKIEALGNDSTIVQYTGAAPPQIGQSATTPAEIFAFRTELKEEFQQLSGVFGVSRGEPPPGIKAGIALQFLEEQENQRQNATVVRYNEYIRRVAKKTLDVAAQFYEKDDDRTLAIFGANQQWMIRHLDPEHLSKPFTVRIQNSSALPESKAGRLQRVLDLREAFPNMLPDEEVLEMLDIGAPNKFFDSGTAAVRTAEAENEQIMSEGKQHPPEEWEFHIEHWEVHVKGIQQPGFNMVSKANQQKMLDHIRAHEMFMLDLMLKNPIYQQRLALLKQFPLLMSIPTPAAPVGAPQPGAPGAQGIGQAIGGAELAPQPVQGPAPGTISPSEGEAPLTPSI